MKVAEINIFPVKSLSGISLGECSVEDRGFEHDRRWLLVDADYNFLTQREFPEMCLLRPRIEKDFLSISDGRGNEISISLRSESEKYKRVKIWSSSVKAQVYEDEINGWFSEYLQTECRLVAMTEKSDRKVNPVYAVRKFSDTVSFADGYPYMLICENSLSDLNNKLNEPLPMNRFRPNLVIGGAKAFAEDNWKKIKIGETIFHIVKPCDRCVVTTIDQEHGVKDGVEPLKTLAEFRRKNSKVLFGQYLIAENAGGVIKVGDQVEILEMKN